jgi:predicted transcriptional regulator
MGQITIYLDDETEKKLQTVIKKTDRSKSRWIRDLIREKTAATWPESIIKLSGAWHDIPTAETIRKEMGVDAEREPI